MITHANKFDIRNVTFANLVQRSFIMIAVFFSLISSSWAATTYYVANNGNDLNNGTSINTPLKTINRAMGKVVAGDTVYVRGGTYREEINAYRGGTPGNYVTVAGYGDEVPVIKGSEIVTGWTLHAGNIWKKTSWKYNSQQVFVDLKDDAGLQQIGRPSSAYGSFEYPSPVGSGLSSMMPGSFYYDPASFTLYVWLPDGSNPNNHVMEASTKRRLFFMGASYIYLKGLAFRHTSSSAFTKQGAAVEVGAYSVMDRCDVQYTDFTGVTMGYLKTGAQLINSNISNNGNSGVNAPASYDFRIAGNIINRNNTRNFNPLWHAGGFKGASKAWGTLSNNEVAYNKGSGIWFDYANSGNKIVVNNNYVHDNGPKEAGIFMEVTKNAVIYNNIVANNERRGIYVSASDNVRVLNNTINGTKGYAGVEINGMPRGTATLTNNSLFNNIISNGTSKYDLFVAKNNGTTILNNTTDYNNYYRAGAVQLSNGSIYSTLEAWKKASLQDKNSLNVDPAYVMTAKTAATQLVVAATSPVVNAGMLLSDVKSDFLDVARPSGDMHDIGAFEIAAAPAPSNDATAPAVSFVTPATEGAVVTGTTIVTASAKDDVGIKSMKIYIDGALKATSTNGQISYTWNTKGVRIGSHSIWVSAVDGKNNLAKAYRNVKVK
ncbi:MAG TPA: right-handed parallel beta-helix repeat-containing protein [Methylophilaceae bacterium]|nr:right-handed parallel beta-helix repeat-containing protein [Methylophilaceae bacterium]